MRNDIIEILEGLLTDDPSNESFADTTSKAMKLLTELKNPKDSDFYAIESQITASLENCACLGRDAYGDYITRMTEGLVESIKKL